MSPPAHARWPAALVVACAVAGCGGEEAARPTEPAPVAPSAATGGEGLSTPTPAPTVRRVTAYRVAEETGWLWVDLEAMRSMDGWDELSSQLHAVLSRGGELASLVDDPAIDPLTQARLLTFSEGGSGHSRVVTMELAEPSAALEAASQVTATAWVPVAGARMAALSTGDDAATIAVDGEGSVVVAGPGYMRGALRVGPRVLDSFWDPGTILAVSFPHGILDASHDLEGFRLWAVHEGGRVHVVARAEGPDEATLEALAARISRRRDALLQSPVARSLGLEEALASARFVVDGPTLRMELVVPERQALTLLGMVIDAMP